MMMPQWCLGQVPNTDGHHQKEDTHKLKLSEDTANKWGGGWTRESKPKNDCIPRTTFKTQTCAPTLPLIR